jgi:hypothetical protein
MADNKFREFGEATPTTPTIPPPTPAPEPSKFRAFGEGGLIKIPTQGTNLGKFEAEYQKQRDEGSSEITKAASQALPIVGGVGGAFLGGPVGAAIGTALGSGVNSKVQGGSNADALIDATIGGGTAYVGGAVLPSIESKIAAALAGTVFNKGAGELRKSISNIQHPDNTTEPDSAGSQGIDLMKDFGINLGLNLVGGAVTNKLNARGATPKEPLGNVANQTREQIVSPGPTQQSGVPSRSTTEYGADAIKSIKGSLAKSEAVEKKAFNNFRTNHVEPNTEKLTKLVGYEQGKIVDPKTGEAPLIPKFEEVEVKGPIYTANTQVLAQKVMPKLDEFMKGETFQQLPPNMQTKYTNLYATIKDLATPFEAVDKTGHPVQIPIKEWETLKEVRTQINDMVGGKPNPTFPQAGLKLVADELKKDIDLSIGSLWRNGPEAEKALAIANKATQFKKQVFTKEIDKLQYGSYEDGKLDTRISGDPSEVFKAAYKSPEKAARLMKALGPNNQGYMKGDYFDNVLMNKGFGSNYSKFNPSAIVTELENPNSVSRTILNADERNNVLRFARAAKNMGDEQAKLSSLSFLNGKFNINLGIAASRATTGSSIPARVVIGGLQLMEAVRDNKAMVDIGSRLIKIRPDSAEAQNASKLFLRGLRGAEVVLNINGEDRPATIGDNGKVLLKDGN